MRLIVVDDDRLVVDSLKIILGAQPQIEVVGTGANGNDAVALYAEEEPLIQLVQYVNTWAVRRGLLVPTTAPSGNASMLSAPSSRSRTSARFSIAASSPRPGYFLVYGCS